MTPETARAVVAAYKRHEAEAGGIARADIKECVRLAAGAIGYVNKQLESKMFTLFNRPEIMRIVLAEVDSQIVALCLEDGYIKLLNQEEVAVFIHEPKSPAPDLLALSLHGEGYVGYVFGGDRLILLDNFGKARKGFPVEGSSAVVLDDLTMTGDKILITVSGSRILTYRFQ